MEKYRLRSDLPNYSCRCCGTDVRKNGWSNPADNDVGERCQTCERENPKDWSEFVRNIKVITTRDRHNSFEAEVLIDDIWYKLTMPCGNWACAGDEGDYWKFTVPIGYWDLARLFDF